ncbi:MULTISPECIES: TonB-dependent hemoglobin/transferrin/lactoferrin family receptor [unclassified Vibrio]|uniref:TonB-dependent hemoglobin/transferrin/lactoferrin family receptor n=1 Tax=unclassified Vibrio TaxID=2614977 RepID=UPI0006478E13|nr:MULTISPECIES: TonB-dependent hemoglobin/transferrin/lactoferrin family receptor [unclassified Vibrio]OXX54361.1 ligand-gated channel [Vibrio sp. V12_P9A6T4]OXX71271.1 ligand-gated channel [Vibrio sp. V19_P1S1T109]
MKLSPITAAVLSVLAVGSVHAEFSLTKLEEVVVSANKVEQPLSKVAGSISAIDGETIEKQGATELYDVLSHEPGISVTGGAGRPQNITIRGMTGNRIAIIQDGVAASDGYGANDINDKVGRNTFALDNIKSIEVVKGAGSTIHGSGAIGGVVVVTTKSPADYLQGRDFYIDASGSYTGISNQYKSSSTLAVRNGNGESLVTISYWQGEETRNFNQDLYNRDIEGFSASLAHDHMVNDSLLLSAKFNAYKDENIRKEGIASIQRDDKWESKEFFEQEQHQTLSASLGVQLDTLSFWADHVDAKLYWRDSQSDTQTNRLLTKEHAFFDTLEFRRERRDESFSDQLIGLSVDLEKAARVHNIEHQFIYGAVLNTNRYERPRHVDTKDSNGETYENIIPFAPAKAYGLGVYLQDRFSLNQWTFSAGLRFDLNNLTPQSEQPIAGFAVSEIQTSEWSPSASVAYQWTPSFNSYLSYNHGYRAPTYDKAYGAADHSFVPLTPFFIAPNMNLQAETSDSFELGSKYDNGQSQAYVAVFYSLFDNFMDTKDVGFDSDRGAWIKQYQNINGVETYGVEFTFAHQLNQHWSTTFKAGYVDGKDDQDEYVRTITPWEGNGQLNYQQQDWDAYARWNWASSMDRAPACSDDIGRKAQCAQTSAWSTVDLGVSYQVMRDLDVSLNIMNLFDREYVRYQDVAGVSQSQTLYSTEPGRYFTATAKYVF